MLFFLVIYIEVEKGQTPVQFSSETKHYEFSFSSEVECLVLHQMEWSLVIALQKTGLCRPLKSFATCQRQGSRQRLFLPTAFKSSRQRILCRLPSHPDWWQRKAVGKGACLAGGKEKLVAKVAAN